MVWDSLRSGAHSPTHTPNPTQLSDKEKWFEIQKKLSRELEMHRVSVLVENNLKSTFNRHKSFVYKIKLKSPDQAPAPDHLWWSRNFVANERTISGLGLHNLSCQENSKLSLKMMFIFPWMKYHLGEFSHLIWEPIKYRKIAHSEVLSKIQNFSSEKKQMVFLHLRWNIIFSQCNAAPHWYLSYF